MPPNPHRTAAAAEPPRPRASVGLVSRIGASRRELTAPRRRRVYLPFAGAISVGVGGEAQRRVVLTDVCPTTRHGLAPRVELDAIGTVDVKVTEERVVPSPKGVVRDGHRNGDVDADHARFHFGLEALRGAAVAR